MTVPALSEALVRIAEGTMAAEQLGDLLARASGVLASEQFGGAGAATSNVPAPTRSA